MDSSDEGVVTESSNSSLEIVEKKIGQKEANFIKR
jgi:hypothetical protein